MIILVLNAGSSSLKYQLFDMDTSQVMAAGVFERIGEANGIITHRLYSKTTETKTVFEQKITDHRQALDCVTDLLTGPVTGAIETISQIDAIGHRVVQGGEAFNRATRINPHVKKAIQENNPLAPLHNPPNLTGIEVAETLFPGVPNVAVFDTEFHQSMPPRAFMYALPYGYYTDLKVRRYGFHGTSHKYVAMEAARLMDRDIKDLNLITIHLGNGCSISAVQGGRCIDTSMGMTPLAGLMMGTRTGDMDPAIISYLLGSTGMDFVKLDDILNRHSGLKGICEMNDMRDIHAAAAKGDARARLATDMFCYRIKKYIGSYAAALGCLDAVIFTAGIGENDAVVREIVLKDLTILGIRLDTAVNRSNQTRPFHIHAPDSCVQVWVISTNEEFQIARETHSLLTADKEPEKNRLNTPGNVNGSSRFFT
ncbi:MAG: acetate kinase [Desulfotignum sp.]|nr:acetate kinase [Desulfotignum sp.]